MVGDDEIATLIDHSKWVAPEVMYQAQALQFLRTAESTNRQEHNPKNNIG
jgi:hypothetical protein